MNRRTVLLGSVFFVLAVVCGIAVVRWHHFGRSREIMRTVLQDMGSSPDFVPVAIGKPVSVARTGAAPVPPGYLALMVEDMRSKVGSSSPAIELLLKASDRRTVSIGNDICPPQFTLFEPQFTPEGRISWQSNKGVWLFLSPPTISDSGENAMVVSCCGPIGRRVLYGAHFLERQSDGWAVVARVYTGLP